MNSKYPTGWHGDLLFILFQSLSHRVLSEAFWNST